VFVYFGTNKLERRSVLAETDTKEKIDTELTIPSHTDGDSQITSKSLEIQEDYVGKYQRSNSSESTNIKSDLKQRYCKHCGGAIDSETKKCSKCGKQYFRLRINWGSTFAFTITVLAIAIAAVSLYRTFQYQNEITLLKDQQALLQNQVDELKSTVYDKNVKITKLEKQIEDKNLKYTRLLKEKQDLQTKVEFYDDCVVFVLDDGTNRYHRYDCVVFKYLRDSFWAFNIEAAKSRGYQACFACD
jgi:RNase P subunit RPR2